MGYSIVKKIQMLLDEVSHIEVKSDRTNWRNKLHSQSR